MEKLRYGSMHSEPQHQMELSGQLQNSATLCLGKEPLVPTDWEVGGCPSQYKCFGE
jgi:hypothetical protein